MRKLWHVEQRRDAYKVLEEKPGGKRKSLGPQLREGDNIKVGFQEIVWNMDLIALFNVRNCFSFCFFGRKLLCLVRTFLRLFSSQCTAKLLTSM